LESFEKSKEKLVSLGSDHQYM